MPEAEIQFLELGKSLNQDERGYAYFPFQHLPDSSPRQEMCSSCHIISIEPGHTRGQHRHPGRTEWLFVVSGSGHLYWRSRDGQVQQRRLDSSSGTLVVIPPGVPHTLRNEGTSPVFMLGWRAALGPAGDGPETVAEKLL